MHLGKRGGGRKGRGREGGRADLVAFDPLDEQAHVLLHSYLLPLHPQDLREGRREGKEEKG